MDIYSYWGDEQTRRRKTKTIKLSGINIESPWIQKVVKEREREREIEKGNYKKCNK